MSPSLYFTKRLVRFNTLGVIVLISERGVTHTTGTQNPQVLMDIHTKFYLNRFNVSAGRAPNHSWP